MHTHGRFIVSVLLLTVLLLVTSNCAAPSAYPSPQTEEQPPNDTPTPVSPQPNDTPTQSPLEPISAVPPGAEPCQALSQEAPLTWDCSISDEIETRLMIFKNIPAGVIPFRVPFDENELRQLPLEGFDKLISIAADLRFYDSSSGQLVTDFPNGATFEFGYTQLDVDQAIEAGYSEEALAPVHTDDKKEFWQRFESFEPDPANRLMIINFIYWGDPPCGYGVPRF